METNEPDPEPLHEYPLPTLTVEWRPTRCIHSAVCVRSLPRVFDPRRRPWVDVTAADAEAIAETVLRCPSGALGLRRHEQRATHRPNSSVRERARQPLLDRVRQPVRRSR